MRYLNNLITFIAFNIYKIIPILFGVVFLFISLFRFVKDALPKSIDYIFWFMFGAFSFSLCIGKCTQYLKKKYNEKNEYYLKLLKRKEERGKLRISYKKRTY